MGIKFRCPNGHKLNVKSFLAGKKGVCPKCGTRMRIPSASDQAAGDSDIGEMEIVAEPVGRLGGDWSAGDAATATAPAVNVPAISTAPISALPPMPSTVPTAVPVPTTAPVAVAAPVAPVAPRPAAPLPSMQPSAPVAVPIPSRPAPSPTAPAFPTLPAVVPAMPAGPLMPLPSAVPMPPAIGPMDPIAEAPGATWYVRPPGGGQYGPARGDVMRKWIAEGRVSADSLVWREGWHDWRNAGQLFPNLASTDLAGPLPSFPIPTSAAASHSSSRSLARKKGTSASAVAFLVILGIACILLVGVLVYVLSTVE